MYLQSVTLEIQFGKYVGWTNHEVKNLVKKAEGGILFIDESYALYNERGSGFEHEAVDTLIAEMENKRDNLCIILVGYEKPMKKLFEMNEGLYLRINHHIFFKNYTSEQLYNIFKQMCRDDKYKVSSNVKHMLMDYFDVERTKETFSNARLVRNLFEKIKITQAQRVVKDTKADMNLITADDIKITLQQLQEQQITDQKHQIGFATQVVGCYMNKVLDD